jgi:peptidyl-prolyl cis-trans isomerase A (cyclophilin A)
VKKLVLLALVVAIPSTFAQEKPLKRGTYAHFETSLGTFTAQLETQLAPKTVANFIALAQGTKEWKDPKSGEAVAGKPFYDGLVFHRIIEAVLIQSGDPTGAGPGGPGYTIADEFSAQLRYDSSGILGMGNRGQPNSGGSQFFITLTALPELYKVNTAFGSVVRGMDVVRKIGSTRTRNEKPVTPVVLQKVRIEIVP